MSLHELLAQCVQEEDRLKRGKIESAHLASTSSDLGNKKRKRTTKGKEPAVAGASGHQEQKKREPCESRYDEAHNTGINKGFHIRRK